MTTGCLRKSEDSNLFAISVQEKQTLIWLLFFIQKFQESYSNPCAVFLEDKRLVCCFQNKNKT